MSRATLAHLARALGGDVAGDHVLCPGPGHTPLDRSLAVWPDGGDVRVHSFADDDWRTCRDHARGLLGIREERPAPPVKPRKTAPLDTAAFVAKLWREAVDPRGTLGERYLAGRGLTLEPELAGRVLRFHASCPFGEGERQPCLLARFEPITSTGEEEPVTAILRVGLTAEGQKIGRKFLGPVAGLCIKLDCDEEVTTGLGIGEGLETCMSVRGRAWRPVWCLGGTAGVSSCPVLSGVESLTIFGDHDENGAGLKAARACAVRWRAAGCEARIIMPEEPGYDWNDVDRVTR